ncbi:hypothetical protein N9W17_05225 [Jannaschia sp.]|nr:hypothetical protein [Jannaschia sp.]
MTTLDTLGATLRAHWKRMLLKGVIFALLFQVLMMVALMVRFQDLPNYVTGYNWVGNVAWIIESTPSWRDIFSIVWEEWLIEIGYMNYDYGMGISEWSLNVIPSRLLILTGLGAMVSWCSLLMRDESCDLAPSTTLRATTGLGAILVAMTNATMSWVVCCATPTWVVGLAMLGMGVSTSLALQTMGPILSGAGFGLLALVIIGLAWRRARRATPPEGAPSHA